MSSLVLTQLSIARILQESIPSEGQAQLPAVSAERHQVTGPSILLSSLSTKTYPPPQLPQRPRHLLLLHMRTSHLNLLLPRLPNNINNNNITDSSRRMVSSNPNTNNIVCPSRSCIHIRAMGRTIST